MARIDVAEIEAASATLRNIRFNLNDTVRFRIEPGCVGLFAGNPEIELIEMPADPPGGCLAEAQFHALIRALAPHLDAWRHPPIWCDVEIVVKPQ